MSMATADPFYTDWECLVDFFAIQGWKIAGIIFQVQKKCHPSSHWKNFVHYIKLNNLLFSLF